MAGTSVDNALPAGYVLGEYVIESVLGHGGFGITYLAKDTRLDSLVAIKEYFPQSFALRDTNATITPLSGDDTAQENYQWGLREFLKEAQALAKFKHNNIVRVLRFLEDNGTAYMVMEYEEGESLSGYLKKAGGFLVESKLLSIFLPILSGLEAVHEAGMLHLDIKPNNIYLRANGKPMLIDFGSARQTKTKSKKNERVALTPGYSAVEQYPDINVKVGPWTDVYSMGATLHRCITGKQPTDAMQRYMSMKEKHIDPMKPATGFDRPNYSGFIREVVVQALRITPKKRPPTAFVMQQGLMGKSMEKGKVVKKPTDAFRAMNIGVRRIIDTGQDKARKRGFFEKVFFFIILSSAIFLFTLQGLLLTGMTSRGQIYDRLNSTLVGTQAFLLKTEKLLKEKFGIRLRSRQAVVAKSKPTPKKPVPINTTQAFNIAKVLAFTLTGHQQPITSLAFLQQGKVLASVSADGLVKLWNVEDGESLRTFVGHPGGDGMIAVSADGRWLARVTDSHVIELWDSKENKTGARLSNGHQQRINAITFSPDGKLLATAGDDKTVILWDITQQKIVGKLEGHKHDILALAFSNTGSQLISSDRDGGIRHWTVPAGVELVKIRANEEAEAVNALAYSVDGKWIASGGSKHHLKLWSTAGATKDIVFKGAGLQSNAIAFTSDNQWLLVGGSNRAVEMWNINSGDVPHQLLGHKQPIQALAVSPDGKVIASGGEGKVIMVWKAPVITDEVDKGEIKGKDGEVAVKGAPLKK